MLCCPIQRGPLTLWMEIWELRFLSVFHRSCSPSASRFIPWNVKDKWRKWELSLSLQETNVALLLWGLEEGQEEIPQVNAATHTRSVTLQLDKRLTHNNWHEHLWYAAAVRRLICLSYFSSLLLSQRRETDGQKERWTLRLLLLILHPSGSVPTSPEQRIIISSLAQWGNRGSHCYSLVTR